MEVSRGSLHKVPAVHLKAEKLAPRVLGVKEVMLEWFIIVKLKPEGTKFGQKRGCNTCDLCDTGALPTELSTDPDLVTL